MQPQGAFLPRGATQITVASTATLAVTASAQQVTIPTVGTDGGSIRIMNSGTQVVFFLYGNLAVTTSGAAMGVPLLPNTVETFGVGPNVTQLSAIAAATGSTLYITAGDGL